MQQATINEVAQELKRRGVEGVSNEGKSVQSEVGLTSGLTVYNMDINTDGNYCSAVAWANGEPSLVFGSHVPGDTDDVEGVVEWILSLCAYLDTKEYDDEIHFGDIRSSYVPPPYFTPEEREEKRKERELIRQNLRRKSAAN